MPVEFWERQEEQHLERRWTERAADALGIDRSRFRGRVPGSRIDALEWEIHRVGKLRTPCRFCGSTGPRVEDSVWCDMLLCDPCRSLAGKQTEAASEDYLRRCRLPRQRLGKYLPDGHGCVSRTTLADRVALGEVNPYA